MNVFLNKKSFWWQKVIGVIALILFIVFLNIFQTQIKNTFYAITSPFSSTLWKSGNSTSNFFESFLNVENIAQENNNLKQENQNLLSQIALLKKTIKQDQSIKEVIQNTQGNNFKIVPAEVIGLNLQGDFMLLDKGFDDGIRENMPVISDQKVLYGKIFKVYKSFSQVMLISNKDNVLNVKIENASQEKTPIYGAVKGKGNLYVYLDLVNYESEIKENDFLVTSALEGIFPKDLLVGKIKSLNKNDLKPFQTAEVQPFFDIKNIDNLFVITNYKREE